MSLCFVYISLSRGLEIWRNHLLSINPHAELAPAILLVIEIIFLDNLDAAFAQPAFPPVSLIWSKLFQREEASVVVITVKPCSWA